MRAMWLIPFLYLSFVGVTMSIGSARQWRATEIDREAALLFRDRAIRNLRARLAMAPLPVQLIRVRGFGNRIALDLGASVGEIIASCYHAPSHRIAVVTTLSYQPAIGWVIGVDGPDGSDHLSAWSLEVHPARAEKA
jgi:hypothetical protein